MMLVSCATGKRSRTAHRRCDRFNRVLRLRSNGAMLLPRMPSAVQQLNQEHSPSVHVSALLVQGWLGRENPAGF